MENGNGIERMARDVREDGNEIRENGYRRLNNQELYSLVSGWDVLKGHVELLHN